MTLEEWVAAEVARTGQNKTSVLRALSEKAQVSLVTLQSVAKGMPLMLYPKALAVSRATDGQVTVQELCE
jgi:DNA-binding phage protein